MLFLSKVTFWPYRGYESEAAQSCQTLWDPMDCSLPSSLVHGIFQARVLTWVTISLSRGSSWPRDLTQVSCIAGQCFVVWATRESPSHSNVLCLVSQSCPTLCDPMDCSPPGSCVHGILQARILEWLPCPTPGDLPNPGIKPRSPALQADSLPSEPPGKPNHSSTVY